MTAAEHPRIEPHRAWDANRPRLPDFDDDSVVGGSLKCGNCGQLMKEEDALYFDGGWVHELPCMGEIQ